MWGSLTLEKDRSARTGRSEELTAVGDISITGIVGGRKPEIPYFAEHPPVHGHAPGGLHQLTQHLSQDADH